MRGVLGKRLLCVLAICTLAMSAVGRLLPSMLEVVAYCCCGPHEVADACHCPDCPGAHRDGERARPASSDDRVPVVRSCLLEQLRAYRPLVSPALAVPAFSDHPPQRRASLAVFTLPAPGAAPPSPRLDEPPRG